MGIGKGRGRNNEFCYLIEIDVLDFFIFLVTEMRLQWKFVSYKTWQVLRPARS